MIEFLQDYHKRQTLSVCIMVVPRFPFLLVFCLCSSIGKATSCLLSKFFLFPGLWMRISFMFLCFSIMSFTYIKVSCWLSSSFSFRDQKVALRKIQSVLVTQILLLHIMSFLHQYSIFEFSTWLFFISLLSRSHRVPCLSPYLVAP